MDKRTNIFLFAIMLIMFVPSILLSQKKKGLVLGIAHERNLQVRNVGINIGVHYKKQYSQVNLTYNYYYNPYFTLGFSYAWFFSYWKLDKNAFKRVGFGYTHRYFPNKEYTRFAPFIEGNLSYSQISGYKELQYYNQILIDKAHVHVFSYFIGYGISFNFSKRFTLLSSFGFGGSYMRQKYIHTYLQKQERFSQYDGGTQIKFSVLYHIKGF